MLDAAFVCSIFLLIGMGIAIDDKALNISKFVGGLSGIGTMIFSFIALKAMNDWKLTKTSYLNNRWWPSLPDGDRTFEFGGTPLQLMINHF